MDDLVAIRKGMRLPDGSRVRFRTIKRDGTTGDRAYDHVEAMRNGKNIGYITLGARGEKAVRAKGYIEHINVKPEYQRKGVGTAMYHHAKQRGMPIVHSDILSEMGRSWRNKVGGQGL